MSGASDTLSNRTTNNQVGEDVQVAFSAEVYRMLEEIAHKKGKPVAEVIEDAIGLEKWYLETREEGGKVIIEGKNGEKWELVQD